MLLMFVVKTGYNMTLVFWSLPHDSTSVNICRLLNSHPRRVVVMSHVRTAAANAKLIMSW